MVILPKDRIEVVLMADQANPAHLWFQSTAELARQIRYGREKSLRILSGAAVLVLLMLYLTPSATVILLLLGLIVIFPLKLVGMVGFFRET